MKKLKVYDLESSDRLVQPEILGEVTAHSPALAVLTDYRSRAPSLIEGSAIAQHTAEIMASEHQNMKLVVDEDEAFRGIVSFEDVSEQNILQFAVENGVNLNDVLVSDLMHTRSSLPAMDYNEVKRSTIDDVLHALREHGQPYCLVVDRLEHRILGVLSLREITRRLNVGAVAAYTPLRHAARANH